jgi:hypothetical protein
MRILNFYEFRCVIQPKRKLAGVGYTGESGLPGVAYTTEPLVQPSRPANPLKGTIP